MKEFPEHGSFEEGRRELFGRIELLRDSFRDSDSRPDPPSSYRLRAARVRRNDVYDGHSRSCLLGVGQRFFHRQPGRGLAVPVPKCLWEVFDLAMLGPSFVCSQSGIFSGCGYR